MVSFSKLPHHLVESFKSTLDEVRESDVLLHVVDISHPAYVDHITTVTQTLHELGVSDKPTIIVFNKMDLYRKKYFDDFIDDKTKLEIEDELKTSLKEAIRRKLTIYFGSYRRRSRRVQINSRN